ncbi:hypothetical protein BsWGS_18076 [Bradybaena similaris]
MDSFPEMAVVKKPKRLNINFNFSDDSDDEKESGCSNAQTKHILKELNTKSNHPNVMTKCLHSTYDKTVISSDHFDTSELPSFSEDLGLPVTESTCLDVYESDPTLYLTAIGDDLNQSQPYHETTADNKYCLSSRRSTIHRHKTSTKITNSTEDTENLHLARNKGEIISQASSLLHNPATDNQDNDSRWSNIGETPRKGNKLSVKHKLYGNDEFFTPLRLECINEKINIPLFQNGGKGTSAESNSSCSGSSYEPSTHKDQSLTGSFVEVQDTSVQTSFVADDIPDSKENRICELQNTTPDCDDSVKSELPLFDSRNQASCSKECEESSIATDESQDDVLATSYEVQDVSVQVSFVESRIPDSTSPKDVESLIPDGESPPKDVTYSSEADECKEQCLDDIQKSFMEMNMQSDQDEFCCTKETLSDDDKRHSRCLEKERSNLEKDVFITNLNKRQFESVRENGQLDTCSIRRGDKANKNQTIYPKNVSFPGNGFGTCRNEHNDCAAKQTKTSVNCSKGPRNTHKHISSNASDGGQSCGALASANDSENEENDDFRKIECSADQTDENNADSIDESEDDEVDCDENEKQSSGHDADAKWMNRNRECNRTGADYGYEEKSGTSSKAVDYKSTDKTQVNTSAEAFHRVIASKSLTKESTLVNVDRSRRGVSESSDDDSDFEKFLNKVKNSSKPKKPVQEEMPMDEFIIDDEDYDSSAATDDDDDDEVFYIKTDNELNGVNDRRCLPPRFQEKAYTYYHSDDSSSDVVDSDSDLDDFIDEHPKNKGPKSKSTKATFDLSSSDESLLGTKPASKNKAKTTSKDGKNKKCNDGEEQLEEEQTAVSRAPSNTPVCTERWKPSFETPARFNTKKEDFKTPRNVKGFRPHPMTAPRPAFGGDGVDDNAFFLKSLNADMAEYKRHAEAARFIKKFKATKEELTQKIFKIFNEAIFEDKLPKDLQIEWNLRLRKTAGQFCYKRSQTSSFAKVVMSVKVCDSPERLRDTLAHELCHAAVRLINDRDESHGVFWRSWMWKINKAFPFMPAITRCHSYHIATKYTYQCVNCKYSIGRHSKSLDTDRKLCGYCRGKFQVYLTKDLKSSTSSSQTPVTSATPRTPNKFAMFVKECYSVVKKREDGLRHGDIMKILSREFAEKNKICD